MKGVFIFFFLMIIFAACDSNEYAEKIPGNDSVNNPLIKYPLPKDKDSLLTLLKILPGDTNSVNVLNALSLKLMSVNPDTSIVLGNQALAIAEKLDWKIGKARTLNNIGSYYYLKAEYPAALNYFLDALKIDEELKDKSGMSKRLGNIGLVYWNQGDFPKALDYDLRALKFAEEIGDKKSIASNLGNIGIVYKEQTNFPKALEYYFRALKIDEEMGNKKGIAIRLGNIGSVYDEQNEYDKALEYFFRALEIARELENKQLQVNNLGNIGTIYELQHDHINALVYYTQALDITAEIGDKNGMARNLANIGSVYIATEKYRDACRFIYRALAIDDSIGAKKGVKNRYETLSVLYQMSDVQLPDSIGGKLLNNAEMRLRSLYYYKKSVEIRDTLFSEENKKQLVRKEMNFDFEKREAATKAEQDKKDALANEELKQKEKERNYFIFGFALVILLAGFIFRGYRQKQKANEIISNQKILVEEKQKEILDSIHYAKRIQESLLPTHKYIEGNLNRLKKNL